MQQAISILDEMIHNTRGCTSSDKIRNNILIEAKSRIQALGGGGKVPTITIPEGTVLLGKDEYEALKEKAWMYDDLCNS